MRRDMDLVRSILLKIEAEGGPNAQVAGYDNQTITKHLEWLEEADLIKANVIRVDQGVLAVEVERLTWAGCDFLDAARNEEVWNKTKSIVAEKTGSVSFEVFKSLLIEVAKSLLRSTGFPLP